MYVTETVRREALLRCFNELLIPEGGRVYLSTLKEQWPGVGLRESDLLDGIDEMQHAGMLAAEYDTDENDLLIELLSPAAQGSPNVLRAFGDTLGVSIVGSSLRQARRRQTGEERPDDERRGD